MDGVYAKGGLGRFDTLPGDIQLLIWDMVQDDYNKAAMVISGPRRTYRLRDIDLLLGASRLYRLRDIDLLLGASRLATGGTLVSSFLALRGC